MMKSLTYALAIGLGCLAAIGLSTGDLWPRDASSQASSPPPVRALPTAAPAASSDALRARIDSLEQALAEQAARMQRLEQARRNAAGAASRASAHVDPLPPPERGQPPQEEPDPDQRYREMQDLLARQTPDPGWETMALTDITFAFEQAAPAGTTLDNVACAGRVCRVDLRHEPGASLDDVLLSDALVPWPHRGQAHPIDEESSVLFLVAEEGASPGAGG